MQQGARHVASGRHATIIAVPITRLAGSRRSAIKVIYGPKSGRTEGSKPHDAVREVGIFQSLDHPNIIPLLEYQYHPDLFEHHLHLPLLPISLASLLDRRLDDELIRSVLYQTLSGLAYIHDKGIAHRDINPRNIMLDWDGTVKLIDFGISWTGGDEAESEPEADSGIWKETKEDMICSVGTGYWRAPELLFSPTSYNPFALDLWAIGVVITDLYPLVSTDGVESDDADDESDESGSLDPLDADERDGLKPRSRLFKDSFGDVGLAASIFRVLGTPSQTSWPDFTSLPDADKIEFVPTQPQSLDVLFPSMATELVDLVGRLLQLSPTRRIAAKDALEHTYFDRVLVPSKSACNDAKCVEEIDGRRLLDYLVEELDESRDKWESPSAAHGGN